MIKYPKKCPHCGSKVIAKNDDGMKCLKCGYFNKSSNSTIDKFIKTEIVE